MVGSRLRTSLALTLVCAWIPRGAWPAPPEVGETPAEPESWFLDGNVAAPSDAETQPDRRRRYDAFRPSTFWFHGDNYFLSEIHGAEPGRVKFQLSIRSDLVELGTSPRFAASFAYTQKSFWDLFAFDRSSPFVENDYRPEVFVAVRPQGTRRDREFAAGVQHESNGLGVTGESDQRDFSRSWNNAFFAAKYGFVFAPHAELALHVAPAMRAWIPFGVGDENADLIDQIGPGELSLETQAVVSRSDRFGRVRLRLAARIHSFEATASYPFASMTAGIFRPSLVIQYFAGRAERLIPYRNSVQSAYLGLGFE